MSEPQIGPQVFKNHQQHIYCEEELDSHHLNDLLTQFVTHGVSRDKERKADAETPEKGVTKF